MSETAQAVEAREASAHRAETQSATFREYIESLLVTVILALFGTTFVVQAFKIPSQSMEPTLLVGDHLLVNKFILAAADTGMTPCFHTARCIAATSSSSNFHFRITRIT